MNLNSEYWEGYGSYNFGPPSHYTYFQRCQWEEGNKARRDEQDEFHKRIWDSYHSHASASPPYNPFPGNSNAAPSYKFGITVAIVAYTSAFFVIGHALIAPYLPSIVAALEKASVLLEMVFVLLKIAFTVFIGWRVGKLAASPYNILIMAVAGAYAIFTLVDESWGEHYNRLFY